MSRASEVEPIRPVYTIGLGRRGLRQWAWQVDLPAGCGVLDYSITTSRRRAMKMALRSIRSHLRNHMAPRSEYMGLQQMTEPPAP